MFLLDPATIGSESLVSSPVPELATAATRPKNSFLYYLHFIWIGEALDEPFSSNLQNVAIVIVHVGLTAGLDTNNPNGQCKHNQQNTSYFIGVTQLQPPC